MIDDDIHHATSGLGLVAPSSCPISRNFAFSAILSRLLIGRFAKIDNPVPEVTGRQNEGRLLLDIGSLDSAAGSSMPQWAVIGWPGQTGQASAAAVSQTVKTKSITGAPGAAYSSQLFDRKPSIG